MDRKKIDEAMKICINATLEYPWEDRAYYMEYLAQAYYYTSYSVRMLAAAAALTKNPEYHRRCIQHISEENGHDNIAFTDFKRMGGDIKDHPELPTTRAFWEPQFVKIQEMPTSLLGYILTLEYKAAVATPKIYQRVVKIHGERCCNFLRVHAEEDPDHVDKAFEHIEKLDDKEQALALQNFEQSTRMYVLFLHEILLKCEAEKKRKAG